MPCTTSPSVWVECFVSVRFDLDIGPKVEHVSPPDALTEEGKMKVINAAFPDCNPDCSHSFIFSFSMTDCTVAGQELLSETVASPTEGSTLTRLYGAAFYRQKQDARVPRGYVQQVIVLLSRLPYVAVHELILRVVAPRFAQCCALSADTEKVAVSSALSPRPTVYYAMDPSFIPEHYTQEQVLDNAIAELAAWPTPHPRVRYEVTLLHQAIEFVTPSHSSRPPRSQLQNAMKRPAMRMDERVCIVDRRLAGSHGTGVGGGLGGVVSSVQDVLPLYGLLGDHMHFLTHLWELVICHEPIFILSNTPSMASAVALAVASLVAPIEFNGALYSYFTVQNEEFIRLSRMGKALPFSSSVGTIVAGTNPFFLRNFEGWPNLLVTLDRFTGSRAGVSSPQTLTANTSEASLATLVHTSRATADAGSPISCSPAEGSEVGSVSSPASLTRREYSGIGSDCTPHTATAAASPVLAVEAGGRRAMGGPATSLPGPPMSRSPSVLERLSNAVFASSSTNSLPPPPLAGRVHDAARSPTGAANGSILPYGSHTTRHTHVAVPPSASTAMARRDSGVRHSTWAEFEDLHTGSSVPSASGQGSSSDEDRLGAREGARVHMDPLNLSPSTAALADCSDSRSSSCGHRRVSAQLGDEAVQPLRQPSALALVDVVAVTPSSTAGNAGTFEEGSRTYRLASSSTSSSDAAEPANGSVPIQRRVTGSVHGVSTLVAASHAQGLLTGNSTPQTSPTLRVGGVGFAAGGGASGAAPVVRSPPNGRGPHGVLTERGDERHDAEPGARGEGGDGGAALSSPLFTVSDYDFLKASAKVAAAKKIARSNPTNSRTKLQHSLMNYFDSPFHFTLDHAEQTAYLMRRLEAVANMDQTAQTASVALHVTQYYDNGTASQGHGAAGADNLSPSAAPHAQAGPQGMPAADGHLASRASLPEADDVIAPYGAGEPRSPASTTSRSSMPRGFPPARPVAAALEQSPGNPYLATLFSQYTVADDMVRKFFVSLTTEFLTPVTAWLSSVVNGTSAFKLCSHAVKDALFSPASFLDHFARKHRETAPRMWTKHYHFKSYKPIYERFANGCLFSAYVSQLLDHKLRKEMESFSVELWTAQHPAEPERIDMFINLLGVVQRELSRSLDPDIVFVTTATSVLVDMATVLSDPLRDQFLLKIEELKL